MNSILLSIFPEGWRSTLVGPTTSENLEGYCLAVDEDNGEVSELPADGDGAKMRLWKALKSKKLPGFDDSLRNPDLTPEQRKAKLKKLSGPLQ